MMTQFDVKPIFQSIFDKQWDALPPVMHKHYANRPYSYDVVTVEGKMRIGVNWLGKLLSPCMWLTRTLVPKAGNNISVTVYLRSEHDSNNFCFDRMFRFPNGRDYSFITKMQPVGSSEMIDWTKAGLGWHTRFSWDGKYIKMAHLGYALRLGKRTIGLPLEWVLGETTAEEEAIDDNRFRMVMDIRHPLFGKIYTYSGEFAVTGVTCE